MEVGSALSVDWDDGALVLQGTLRPWWAYIPMFAIPTFALAHWISKGAEGGAIAAIVMSFFVLMPTLFVSIPRIEARFDIRSREVMLRWSFLGNIFTRNWTYPFDEIEGLAVREYSSEGRWSYMPVLMLRTGKHRWLAPVNGSYPEIAPTLHAVGKAAGIETTEIQGKRFWS